MERTLSQEERIRRAEEIYNRRKKENNSRYKYTTYNDKIEGQSKLDFKSKYIRKMLIQILVCMLIYLILYAIQNSNCFFSAEVHNKINEFLSYDLNFNNMYTSIVNYIKENKQLNSLLKLDENKEDEQDQNEVNQQNAENTEVNNENTNTEAVGGADQQIQKDDRSQSEIDTEYIKQNYNIIWPLKGTITSKYGPRKATAIVTANHYGTDIAGNIGDNIISAMDGKVTYVSEEGDYGKHIRIENNDVMTLYAHCSALCVEQGKEIKQGEIIAKVGQTGRATGPHLHFEIRRDNRTLDPEGVLGNI